jgi:hypothetical protein
MPPNKQNSLFFLGGHDLQMLEIKNILWEELRVMLCCEIELLDYVFQNVYILNPI